MSKKEGCGVQTQYLEQQGHTVVKFSCATCGYYEETSVEGTDRSSKTEAMGYIRKFRCPQGRS